MSAKGRQSRAIHITFIFFVLIGVFAYFTGNAIDNIFSPRPCPVQNLFIFNCPGLGLAGATPVGFAGSLGAAVIGFVIFEVVFYEQRMKLEMRGRRR
jgi:hypothetical protein